jgi:hypothetical protein
VWNAVKVHYEARKESPTQRKLLSPVEEKENFGEKTRHVWEVSKRFNRYKNRCLLNLLVLFVYSKDGARKFLRNLHNFVPNYTASYPTRQYSSYATQ